MWYDFFSGERVSTSGSYMQIPVPLYSVEKPLVAHVRGGKVVPLQNPAVNTHLRFVRLQEGIETFHQKMCKHGMVLDEFAVLLWLSSVAAEQRRLPKIR